ncbi:tape measure protein (plasmid) [Skermanella sp. TT6]|uniref:Tape measure protein n=1 Tax=Skermanella cutis TaxID=2775420 RepID=A0ABX7BIX7_9PROT|nr:tape measure protein [Skermanella sp. TT6]QQP94055.1 tape measure protein [Skermanella sp. TT6]
MADHSIRISIDSSGAESGANRVSRSLKQIQDSATRTVGRGDGIKIGIDGSGAETGGRRVLRTLEQIRDEARRSANINIKINNDNATKSLRDVQGEAVQGTAALTAMSGAARGLVGVFAALQAADLGREIVNTTARFQDLQTRLETLTGSSEKAAEAQRYLSETAQRMSTDFFALSDSYVKFLPLIKAGVISTEEARTTLEGLGNMAAATGAKADQLGNVMYGLGQALSSPKTNVEDLNQVVEPLPGLLQELDKAAGLPSGGFKKMVADGRVTAAFFKQTLITALQEYQGAAEKTAGNINATSTRMKNAWDQLLNTVGQKVEPGITATLEVVTMAIGGLERGILGLIRGLDGVWNGVQRIAALIKNLDWSAPIESFSGAWEKAKADNQAMPVVPALGAAQGAAPTRPGPTIPRGATLLPEGGGKGGGGRGGKSDAVRELENRRKAFDDLLVRYSDETDAMAYQSLHYGQQAQEIDRLTAQYKLWNAAKEAGVQKDQVVIDQIASVSTAWAQAQETARQNAEAERLRADAVAESASIYEQTLSPIQQYQAGLAKLTDLLNQFSATNGEVGISQETFNRALADMRTQLNGDAAQVFEDTRTEAERYSAALAKLEEMARLYIETNGQLGISQETFNRALNKLQTGAVSATPALDDLVNSIPTVGAALDIAARNGLLSFEDALVDIVTGAKSAKEAFADMARAIAQDLARMAIRMAIIKPLGMALGIPMLHTGGIVGRESSGTKRVSAFHTGGIAGGAAPMTRTLPPIGDWNRYHAGGLASNEVPAVLQAGEGVFTKQQMAALAPAGGGGHNINMPISVTVGQSPGGDPGAGERQAKMIARQVQQAMDDNLMKALRPGGLLNQNGY